MSKAENGLPSTVQEAVDAALQRMCKADKTYVAKMGKDEFRPALHHSLGRAIRNEFGLWSGNEALLKACRRKHPDDASAVIVTAIWKSLQKPSRLKCNSKTGR